MTLKEIRISKGLTQSECSEYLGVSLRTYQNYENDDSRMNTSKYSNMLSKLENYGINPDTGTRGNTSYHTNVVIGKGISALCSLVTKYKKRECFGLMEKFIRGTYDGKICVLYGLRRTGKTTMLFQMIGELPQNQSAYVKIQTTDTMADLTKDMYILFEQGYRYIFIDEITLLSDFIDTSAVLSDIFAAMGMKIVVSGTDSLGFAMADRDELYDRNIMIHTSFIPFREYERLLGICSVDSYIEYGGTLKMENMSFDDPESVFDDVSFRDDESTRKYIDTAISRNIQHTLKNDSQGEYFNELKELYNQGELTNAINRIVESMNHDFVLKVIEEEFKSHDLGSAKELLLHGIPDETAYILYDTDNNQIVERLKKIIEIKEKEECSVRITDAYMEKIKKYLTMLDLIVNCPDVYENGIQEEHYIFAQPGMRYSIAKALVYSLKQDEYFRSVSEKSRQYIIRKILDDVKGRMLEEIVMLETSKTLSKGGKAFKFKFDNGGEFDMVIYDDKTDTCSLYEIKHSDKISEKQTRYLMDETKCSTVEKLYGKISGKYVLYRGKSCISGEIQYLNVEEYLKKLV